MTPPTRPAPNLADEARAHPSWSLVTSLALLERGQRAAEAGASLGTADARLMWLFSDHQPRTQREVSDALGLEQSTVNRQVNAAVAAGLLRRHSEPGRPAKLLEATDEGLTRFAEDLRRHLDLLDRATEALPARDRERFGELLATFVTAYAAAATPRGR